MKQEITIPEGCKATIDHDNRIVVIESKKEFKRGDILSFDHRSGGTCVFILERYINEHMCTAFCGLLAFGKLKFQKSDGWGITKDSKLATPSEQQILFDALAKEGKKWNPDTLEIEDIEQKILVPESVSIFRNSRGSLGIGFNKDKQILYCNAELGLYYVVIHSDEPKVQCYLQPCKREDLKAGDTAFCFEDLEYFESESMDLSNYCKILNDAKNANISIYGDILTSQNNCDYWYKLIPINDTP